MENLEEMLTSICDSVEEAKDVKRLGKELGLERQEIKKYLKNKKVVGKGKYTQIIGTREMLEAWAKGKDDVKVIAELRAALKKAGLLQHQVVEADLPEPVSAHFADETHPPEIQEVCQHHNHFALLFNYF